jgi:putative ATPase
VNNALLSRARVYVLKALRPEDIVQVLAQACADAERGLGRMRLNADEQALDVLAAAADGDARRGLNLLEVSAELAAANGEPPRITVELANEVAGGGYRRFDKRGELFYDQISALHKAVRGTDPDAALYWYCRMIDGGCDPLYVARRIVRMASEDIGNADPRALELSLAAWDAYERLGTPEGELMLAQAVVYMACAPKSNAVYKAYGAAMADAKESGTLEVPLHIRNAPTRLMKELGYGASYRYAHDEPDAYAAGENYFPEELRGRSYYHPVPRGLEIRIGEALARLRASLNDKDKK